MPAPPAPAPPDLRATGPGRADPALVPGQGARARGDVGAGANPGMDLTAVLGSDPAPPAPGARGPEPSDPGLPRALDRAFAALADPTRRAILTLLLEDDMAVTDVASAFPVSLAAVSRHLQVLAEAGLIAQERRGRITWCKLLPNSLRESSAWMAGFGMFAAVDLDGLERLLAEDEAGPPQADDAGD